MHKTTAPLLFLGLCFLPGALLAQSPCPELPSSRNLSWESSSGPDYEVCRAVDAQGQQVLGMMLTKKKPGVRLLRSQRREEGWVGAHAVHWYRPNIAGEEAVEKRITVLELEDGRYAQVWIDANDPKQLQAGLELGARLGLE